MAERAHRFRARRNGAEPRKARRRGEAGHRQVLNGGAAMGPSLGRLGDASP